MAASIMAAADYSAGVTSTDFIRVGETIIDRGDYSGTGGARTLLRHHDTGMAVLEVARGGLLRRGLGVSEAVITNVAADHLGEYGINTVPDLIEAKFIVRRALGERGTLILNADDPGISAFAENLDESLKRRIHWFSTVADHSRVIQGVLEGGAATVFQDGWLVALAAQKRKKIVPVSEIPAALAGAAKHNVSNALAAMALCRELGISGEAIRQGLAEFRGDASDNPGRGNWFEHNGVRILVDFAHNEHGMSALADMVCALPSERLVLAMGQAGDRLDDSIAAMTRAACRMNPDQLMICALPGYERGRSAGEVFAVIRGAAIAAGLDEASIREYSEPVAAAGYALEHAQKGDLLVFLALTQREEVLELIRKFGRT
jgi:UDP-N-acetylmuramyl tripeptide synthase